MFTEEINIGMLVRKQFLPVSVCYGTLPPISTLCA